MSGDQPTPAHRLSRADLATALITGIAHHGLDWGEQAAIHLIAGEGTWLGRAEFRRHVTTQATARGLAAWVDWAAVATEPDVSPASSGERAILRLAAQLAGHLPDQTNDRWALGSILSCLDEATGRLASRAVFIAALGPAVAASLRNPVVSPHLRRAPSPPRQNPGPGSPPHRLGR